jgi:hypothetical protein
MSREEELERIVNDSEKRSLHEQRGRAGEDC